MDVESTLIRICFNVVCLLNNVVSTLIQRLKIKVETKLFQRYLPTGFAYASKTSFLMVRLNGFQSYSHSEAITQ